MIGNSQYKGAAPLPNPARDAKSVGALTVLGAQAEPQMRMTIRHAVEAGATPREIAEVIYQMSIFGGLPAMTKALEIAQGVFGEMEDKE